MQNVKSNNPFVQKYGNESFLYLKDFYPGLNSDSDLVTIPYRPFERKWSYTHIKPQYIGNSPIPETIPEEDITHYVVELKHFAWPKQGIDFLAGYIPEIDTFFEYDLNRLDNFW